MMNGHTRRDSARLDRPRTARRRHSRSLQTVLDALAQGIGTGRFIAAQNAVFVAWIGINVAVPAWRWDFAKPYPFILLTLVISAQAAYAAPLILHNQHRQTDVDRTRIEKDRTEAQQAERATEYVIAELAALRTALDKAMRRDVVRQELAAIRNQIRAVQAHSSSDEMTTLQPPKQPRPR